MSNQNPPGSGTPFRDWLDSHQALRNAFIAAIAIIAIGILSGIGTRVARFSAANAVVGQSVDGGQSGGGADSTTTNSSTASDTPSDTTSTTAAPLQFDGGAPTIQANGTVQAQGPVILPATKSVVDADTLFPDAHLDKYLFDVVRGGTLSTPVVEGLVEVDHPADGLNPEYHELDFVRLAPDGQSVATTKRLLKAADSDGADPTAVWGTTTGLLVVGIDTADKNDDRVHGTSGIDPSGATVWSASGQLEEVIGDVPIIQTSYQANDPHGYTTSCQDVDALDVTDGKVRWSVSGRSLLRSGGDCGSPQVEPGDQLNGGTSDAPTQRYVTVEYSDGSDSVARGENRVPTTGDVVQWRSTDRVQNGVVDPTSGDVFSAEGTDSDGKTYPAEVYDPSTGKVLWSMPYTKANQLDLQVHYFYGGRLYASNSAQNILIDVATNAVQNDGWSDNDGEGVPIAVVDGYTVTTTGYLLK